MSLTELSDEELFAVPLDRLAEEVLAHLAATNEWNIHNFFVGEAFRRRGDEAKRALIETTNWLLANGLIARGHPTQSHPESMIITRLGQEVLASGLDGLNAQRRLSVNLHPRLARVRSQFLLGEYELAAFAAMREVEIRARELSRLDASLVGVKLMREAWKPDGGPLADPSLDPGERVGTMELFSGAIGTFKNPPSHRQVDYGDPVEASEVIMLADLLMRLLDRTAERLGR
jgi:uncharacterized protein (TIGR02391 family)